MSEKMLAPARHESSDVGTAFIWLGVLSVVALVLVLALIVLWLFPGNIEYRTLRLPLPQYPNPQLQTNPREEMAAFRDREMHKLNSAGWVDRTQGIVHIPIAQAMRKVAQEGIAGWPTAEKQP
jgi:hypothetical protein